MTVSALSFLFRQIVYDALALEVTRKRLPAASPFLRNRFATTRCSVGIVVIGAIRLRWRFRFRLPRLPGGRKKRQLIGGELFALAAALGVQQLAQQQSA